MSRITLTVLYSLFTHKALTLCAYYFLMITGILQNSYRWLIKYIYLNFRGKLAKNTKREVKNFITKCNGIICRK